MSEASILTSPENPRLVCEGDWSLAGIKFLADSYQNLQIPQSNQLIIDASKIDNFDNAGAWLVHKIIERLSSQEKQVKLEGLKPEFQQLFNLIEEQSESVQPIAFHEQENLFYQIGEQTVHKIWQF